MTINFLYRHIMGKGEIYIFLFQWGYLEFLYTSMFIEKSSTFLMNLSKSLNSIVCKSDKMYNVLKIYLKNLL